jgi:hypothetical protein
MKITKKQRKRIVERVIANIESQREYFLCVAFGNAISTMCFVNYGEARYHIKKFIPGFKKSIAIKYFGAKYIKNCSVWWNDVNDEINRNNRLAFLNYLLTSKLPKKAKTK